ncbi:unnamed protein product [Linum trigynum]|uniref:Uncharacterized protein n=1 Tax=Linum trigynum TaxID=586398 RepID=A0AAV2E113_9ROSI
MEDLSKSVEANAESTRSLQAGQVGCRIGQKGLGDKVDGLENAVQGLGQGMVETFDSNQATDWLDITYEWLELQWTASDVPLGDEINTCAASNNKGTAIVGTYSLTIRLREVAGGGSNLRRVFHKPVASSSIQGCIGLGMGGLVRVAIRHRSGDF